MPTIRNSEQGRRLAKLRWERRRQREAEAARVAEAWGSDALAFSVMTKAEQDRLIGAAMRQGAEGALREVAPSVVLAAAEMGVNRATAERLGDLVALLAASAISNAGGPEVTLPAPESWRAEVAWDAIYGLDGNSLVTGAIARESQAEKAEPTGGD